MLMKHVEIILKRAYGVYLTCTTILRLMGSSWLWLYGSWIYNYLCNQCLSSLPLWVIIQLRLGVLNTTVCDKVCQW